MVRHRVVIDLARRRQLVFDRMLARVVAAFGDAAVPVRWSSSSLNDPFNC